MVKGMVEGVCTYEGSQCIQHADIHHSSSKVITEEGLCTFQAVIKQVGFTSMALMCVLHEVVLVEVSHDQDFYCRSLVRVAVILFILHFPYRK